MGINECYFVVVLFCFDIYFVVSTLYEYILYDNFTTCVCVLYGLDIVMLKRSGLNQKIYYKL